MCNAKLQADNFDAVERVGVCASHRKLLADKKVFELIKNWLGVSSADVKMQRYSKTSKVMDISVNLSTENNWMFVCILFVPSILGNHSLYYLSVQS